MNKDPNSVDKSLHEFLNKKEECWTDKDKELYVEGLRLHGKNWKKIHEHMGGTKLLDQIKTYS